MNFYFYSKLINFGKFKLGGRQEKHAVAAWNLGNHLSIGLKSDDTDTER
jgi:hypothetical protein